MWSWLACAPAPEPPPVVFVRDGLVLGAAGEGRVLLDGVAPDRVVADWVAPDRVAPDRIAPDRIAPDRVAPDRIPPDRVAPDGVRDLPDGRRLVERPWQPGERLQIDGVERVAPLQAECLPLFSVALGDASAGPALGGDSPDTALAFSPDGDWLAIGTWRGEVLVVDGWTGAVRARRALAETLIRQVAWSADGRVVYAAEQSPDARVHALDAADLGTRASYRLADDVGTSPAPPDSDPYGVYTLPAAYALEVLPGGDLLVSAAHGWDEGGGRRNASRLVRLRPELAPPRGESGRLAVVAAWPAEGPADAVFGALAIAGDQVAVALRRSASGEPPADLPIDGVQRLTTDLRPLDAVRFAPLAPHYRSTFVWEALALAGTTLVVGFGDGRLVVGDHVEALGAPVLAGDVPIAASVGFARVAGDHLFAITSKSAIPYGAAAPELRPPRSHPEENTLTAYTVADGEPRRAWAWRGPQVLTGLAATERELAVGAGPREDDDRTDLFGALIFAVGAEGPGAGQPRAFCATRGPAYHRLALAPDGRVAVAEVPWRRGDEVRGEYRATVLR